MSSRRTSLLAALAALAALVASAPAVAGPAALAAQPTVAAPVTAQVCAAADATFCVDYGATVLTSGATTDERRAAAPADVGLSFADTSPTHDGDTGRWLKSVAVDLLSSTATGPLLTASADLPDGLLVAGDAAACGPGADHLFTECTAGRGRALVNITGTGFFDGPHAATFGIQRVRNVNPVTTPGALAQYAADLTVTFDTGGYGQFTQNTTATLVVLPPAPGSSTRIVVDVTGSVSQSFYGYTATGDLSLDSLTLSLRGIADQTVAGAADRAYDVLRLPATCGDVSAGGSATARNGAAVTVPLSLTVTGCPVATAPSATGTAPYTAAFSATSTSPLGRPIAFYHWDFGDGSGTTSTSATTTHTYPGSTPRTVTVTAEDTAGALSAPVGVTVPGTRLTLSPARPALTNGGSTVLRGRLTDSGTGAGLAGRAVTVLRCGVDGTGCVAAGQVTTSSSTPGAFALGVRPAANSLYLARFTGAAGMLGTETGAPVGVRPAITFGTSASTVRHGTRFTLSGTVSPRHAGRPVQVQEYLDGEWTTVATRTLTRTSSYSLVVRARGRGVHYYQVLRAADADHLAATSHPVLVKVT